MNRPVARGRIGDEMEVHPSTSVDCCVELPAWRLNVTHLLRQTERDLGNVMETALGGAVAYARSCAPDGDVSRAPDLAEIRAGIEGGAAAPPLASELCIRRVLEDPGSVRGPRAWEFLHFLTLKSQAPWGVVDSAVVRGNLHYRRGRDGERFAHRAGELDCGGLAVLADEESVLATPWTEPLAEPLAQCEAPIFVCFLPADLYRKVDPRGHMGRAIWVTWAYFFLKQRTCTART